MMLMNRKRKIYDALQELLIQLFGKASKELTQIHLERIDQWLGKNLTKVEDSSVMKDLKNQEEMKKIIE